MDFISHAYAMGTTGGTGTAASQGGGWQQMIFLFGPIFIIFYFLLFRPQQKQRKQHNEMLKALKKGDKIVTSGGIYGEVTGIENNAVTIEIAPKVRIKVSRESISVVIK